MAFITQAVTVLQTLVIALGAGLAVWGVVNQIEGIRAKIAHIGIEVKYILIFIPFDFSGEVKIQIVVIDRCRSLERAIGILACNGDVFVRVIFEHNGVYHQIRPYLQRLVLSQ